VNWLAFIAALAGSLAWPLTVVIIVLIFRRPLLAVAPSLREFELGSLKLKFAEGLAQAASVAEQIAPAPSESPVPTKPDSLHFGGTDIEDNELLLAVSAPGALVLQSFVKVEQALFLAAANAGLDTNKRRGVRIVAQELEKRGALTPEIAKIVQLLGDLRNEAAHLPNFGIEPRQALEYARLARHVVAALKSAEAN
jgi:hypothetical protein